MKVYILKNCFGSQWSSGLANKSHYVLLGPNKFSMYNAYEDFKYKTGSRSIRAFGEHLIRHLGFKRIDSQEDYFYHGRMNGDIL